MPSKSEKQHKTMCACANDKEFADKVGIPQHVCKEFCKADESKDKKDKKD
jgi:hypothetical protein